MKSSCLSKLKVFIGLLLIALSFYRCAAGDTPWGLLQDDTSTGGTVGSGGTAPGTTTPPPAPGCAVSFTTTLQMDLLYAKAGAMRDPGVPRSIPNVILHFNGNQVAINSATNDFKTSTVTVGTGATATTLILTQKSGTNITGTYDAATGKIEMNGAIFKMDAKDSTNTTILSDYELPPFSLKTEDVKVTTGDGANSMSDTGHRLDASKNLTLMGGVVLPANFPGSDLRNAAVLIILKGAVDKLPTGTDCSSGTGTGTGTGSLDFFEVDHGTETSLATKSNTLDFGTVFIPEAKYAGDDPVPAMDSRFNTTKILRIKNNASSDADATISSLVAPFSAKVSGNPVTTKVTVPKNSSVDVEINFGYTQAVDYKTSPPPDTEKKTFTIGSADQKATITGNANKAAPLIVMLDQGANQISTQDFGVVTALIDGDGASAKLVCKNVPWSIRRLSVKNIGTRGIENLKIQTTDSAPTQNPECPFYVDGDLKNREFYAGLTENQNQTQGMASCKPNAKFEVVCTLPGGVNDQVNFDVTYRPINASPIAASQPDTGQASFTYTYKDENGNDKNATSSSVNLTAGVAADHSNVLKLQNKTGGFDINSGGLIKINIPDDMKNSATVTLTALNSSDKPLTIQDIVMNDTHFTIAGLAKTDTIPARSGSNPGQKDFTIQYTKVADLPVTTSFALKFTEGGLSAVNTFTATLTGTYKYVPPTGYYEFQIDKFTAFVNHPFAGLIDSIDYRQIGKLPGLEKLKTGPILLRFELPTGKDPVIYPYRKVSFGQPKVLDAMGKTPSQILSALRGLTREQRTHVLRIYTTQLTNYSSGSEDQNKDGVPDCTDPANIDQPYRNDECSFFYYVVEGADPGVYDDRNGTLILPSTKLRLLEPYHTNKGEFGNTTGSAGGDLYVTNTLMSPTTMTTGTISALTTPKADYTDIWTAPNDIPLVDLSKLSLGDLAVGPASMIDPVLPANQCPPNWTPWANDMSKFGCNISPSSPYYIHGLPLTQNNGTYYMTVGLLTKFNAKNAINGDGKPENVPFFMADHLMWATIQGRLFRCEDAMHNSNGWTDCPSYK